MLVDLKNVATVDFETLGIDDRPHYPPAPVGVAVKIGAKPSRYYAWGHISGGNNCSWGEARRVLAELWASGRPILMHNAGFDTCVAEVHMGMPRLTWARYHDTVPGLFICEPRAQTYSLKPSSERLLSWAPEERDAVTDWLVENQPVPGIRISATQKSEHYASAYIAHAPPSLVGPYACGDVDRTWKLAEHVFGQLETRDMQRPYDLERRLMPIILDMESQGVRVDVKRLEHDVELYQGVLVRLETWLRTRLKARAEINLDSGCELAAALIRSRLAVETDFPRTPTGQISTSKEALDVAVKDPQALAALRYRSQLCTSLRTFLGPWLAQALMTGGLIYFRWHSTRQSHDTGNVGARTGRLSSTPNAQNIPKIMPDHFKGLRKPIGLPSLPNVRGYIIPYEKGHVLIDRDFQAQEIRVAVNYENGELLQAYRKNPDLDLHQLVADQTSQTLGRQVTRKDAKVVSLSLLYGVGLGHLAEMLGVSVGEAKQVKSAYFKAFPSMKELIDDCTQRWKTGGSIRTLGGREYFGEESKVIDGRLREFSYKSCNTLVQGSSADLTKLALCDYWDVRGGARVLATIHDELLVSAPRKTWRQDMERLREAMERPRMDCPIRSEGKMGMTFAECK